MFLKEDKYIEKEKKEFIYITYDLGISSDDSDYEVKTKYSTFLTRVCNIVRSQQSMHKSLPCFLINSDMF